MLIEFTDNSNNIQVDNSDSTFVVYFENSVIYLEVDSQEFQVLFTEYDTIPIEFSNILRATNEGETMYSKRVDFINDNLLYRGEAIPGSSTSSSVWRIRKIVISVDGDIQEVWADGSSEFIKIWDNRLSYTYI